jgi:hypothetical protein
VKLNAALSIIAIIISIGIYKTMKKPKLKYFKAPEFRAWWPLMNNDLLLKLDAFREAWAAPVEISKASGSLGRHGGNGDGSQHNIDLLIEVGAVDVFPKRPDGSYISTIEERQRAYEVAISVGFTGIGIYTDTSPGNLLHLDNRDSERVALWSRIDGEYLGINEVLV